MSNPVKCVACGRFIGLDEMGKGGAEFHFEPDSHRGPEVSEWTCAACAAPKVADAASRDEGLLT